MATILILVIEIDICSYVLDISMVGRDNTSLKIANYYINTLVGSFDDVQLRIKVM
jgi:hypothetical protein